MPRREKGLGILSLSFYGLGEGTVPAAILLLGGQVEGILRRASNT